MHRAWGTAKTAAAVLKAYAAVLPPCQISIAPVQHLTRNRKKICCRATAPFQGLRLSASRDGSLMRHARQVLRPLACDPGAEAWGNLFGDITDLICTGLPLHAAMQLNLSGCFQGLNGICSLKGLSPSRLEWDWSSLLGKGRQPMRLWPQCSRRMQHHLSGMVAHNQFQAGFEGLPVTN